MKESEGLYRSFAFLKKAVIGLAVVIVGLLLFGYLFFMGAGFQFTPSLVLRPSLNLAAGADLIDDTVFGLSVTFALPH